MANEQDQRQQAAKEVEVDRLFKDNVTNIVPVNLEDEMRTSFIDYAMSVITDRALPDVRDGLKPVHRRILYSMQTQGFTPDKAYRKCATTVGDVLGRFHPHGDASVYDALVRLAQDFSMRHTLVDGHGNFGSRDGDPPAAYRYAEARLTKIAMELMRDIRKDTVDFQPNYDDHDTEPIVMPAHFPNLIVNGSSGIAVGMATNIPPQNLGETIDGVIYTMHNPDCTVDNLMQIIQAPDFPTGGTIMGLSGVREAYQTGRGRIVVRAHAEIEPWKGNRYRIVVHDLPYQVNKARLIERIAQLARDKRLEGISMVRDESDRSAAVRIVIELKQGANANVVLNQLYRRTQLEDAFNANMLSLVPDESGISVPRLLNLKQMIEYYIDHQKEVVTRRTKHDLEEALARRHIVEGLQVAIDNIDEVITIIRSSAAVAEARERLELRFDLSAKQSQAIVEMTLGKLTGLEREKLNTEYETLTAKINDLQNILTDEARLISVIEEELLEVRDKYADERRTRIDPTGEIITDEALIKEEDFAITLTHVGYIKRVPAHTYESQHRGGRGISGMSTRDEDYAERVLITSTHDMLLFFTDRGRVYKLKAYEIPESSRTGRGTAVVNLLQLQPDEGIQTMIPIHDPEEGGYLFFATRLGQVKRTELSEFRNIHKGGIIAIALNEDDCLINVIRSWGDDEILLVTANGQSIRFLEEDARPMGRDTRGVRGIRLRGDDEVVGMIPVLEGYDLFLVSANGYGKRVSRTTACRAAAAQASAPIR